MKILNLSHVPPEIFATACVYEGVNPWGVGATEETLTRAREAYVLKTGALQERIGGGTSGLEKALADFFLRQGNFSEKGKYAYCKGFSV